MPSGVKVISTVDKASDHDAKDEKRTSNLLGVSLPSRPPVAVLACIAYTVCSTALTLANKHIFSSKELNYPWMLLSTQSAVAVLVMQTYLVLNKRAPFSFTLFKQMLFPCVLFTLYIFTNAAALRLISLPILSVLKSLAPMGIALSELALFGERISPGTWVAMLLIVIGNTVTVITDVEYSQAGYLCAIANVIINIIYVLSLRICLSNTFTPVEKTVHSNLIAFSLMIPTAFVKGETVPFLNALMTSSWQFRAIFFLSCSLCAGIGASIFWVIETTSGSTLSFVGACNKFVVVILGGILFKAKITPVGWVSVFFGVLAGVVFAVAKAGPKEQPGPARGTDRDSDAIVDLSDEDEDQVVTSLLVDDEDRLSRGTLRAGRG